MPPLTEKESNKIILRLSIAYTFTCPIIALLTPDGIMDSSWAVTFVSLIEHIVPYVSYVVRCGPTPAVHFVAAAVGLTGTLYWLILIYLGFRCNLRVFIENWGDKRENLKKIGMLIPAIALGYGFVWVFYSYMPHSACSTSPLKEKAMISSKLAMGTYGAVVLYGGQLMAFALFTSVVILLCLLRIYFVPRKK